MTLGTRPYQHGLIDLGDSNYAWLQPDGGWGWSNAGLIIDGTEALLVDTLFDLALTRRMLDGFEAALPGVAISTLVNTHANGDHCNGNELVTNAEIVCSVTAAEEMAAESPEMMKGLLAVAPTLGVMGEFFLECFDGFEFDGIERPSPTTTFTGTTTRTIGDSLVELVEVGPAHTGGDVLVHIPGRSTVYTGDILFIEGHPILWAGTVPDLLSALDRIEEWQPETIVPGHGPVTDLAGLHEVREYLEYCRSEARTRFDAGMDVATAAGDVALDRWADWGDPERIVTTIDACYREFRGDDDPTPVTDLFATMAARWDATRSA